MAIKGAAFAALAAGAYALLLIVQPDGLAAFGLAAVAGVAVLMLAVAVAHDAAHEALPLSRRANHALAWWIFALLGVDGRMWRLRHCGSHHSFPNVRGGDVDMDDNPLVRMSPRHARRPWQRWQHLYAPAAYGLVLLHSIFVGDMRHLLRRRLGNMHGERPGLRAVASFTGTKLVHLGAALAAPLAVLRYPWPSILAGYVAVTAVASLLFVGLLVATHFAEETRFPVPDADGRLPGSWAAHAIATSLDWNPTSRIANAASGGANAHAAHHLFPRLPHPCYVGVSRLIAALAPAHGVSPNVTTVGGMFRSHVRHLRRLGEDARAA